MTYQLKRERMRAYRLREKPYNEAPDRSPYDGASEYVIGYAEVYRNMHEELNQKLKDCSSMIHLPFPSYQIKYPNPEE